MGRFAKNFLPILFNVYSQPEEDGASSAQRRSVLDTVRAYLTITDPQVRGEGPGAVGQAVLAQASISQPDPV